MKLIRLLKLIRNGWTIRVRFVKKFPNHTEHCHTVKSAEAADARMA